MAFRNRCLGLLVICLSLEIAACGGSPPSASQSSSPLEDCRSATAISSANASAGPVHYITLVVDGKRRDYRLFQPPGLVNSKPIPLVIALHGTPMSSDQWQSIAHFDDEATKAGFLAAYPDGCNGAWQYSDGGSKVPDLDFISQVIDRIETEFPIDKARVFMVGVSAGSVMTYRLACDLSKQIVAIASVSGAMRPDACQPAQPVSVLERCTVPTIAGREAAHTPNSSGWTRSSGAGER